MKIQTWKETQKHVSLEIRSLKLLRILPLPCLPVMGYSLACDRMTAVDDPLFVKIYCLWHSLPKLRNYPHSEPSFIVFRKNQIADSKFVYSSLNDYTTHAASMKEICVTFTVSISNSFYWIKLLVTRNYWYFYSLICSDHNFFFFVIFTQPEISKCFMADHRYGEWRTVFFILCEIKGKQRQK